MEPRATQTDGPRAPEGTPRYLCSHLLRLTTGDGEQWANLEEIWGAGAELTCDTEVASGAHIRIFCEHASFEGRVTSAERDETGWRVQMAFSMPEPWTIEQWRPDHALDLATLGKKSV